MRRRMRTQLYTLKKESFDSFQWTQLLQYRTYKNHKIL